jgi:hypothetical protein
MSWRRETVRILFYALTGGLIALNAFFAIGGAGMLWDWAIEEIREVVAGRGWFSMPIALSLVVLGALAGLVHGLWKTYPYWTVVRRQRKRFEIDVELDQRRRINEGNTRFHEPIKR